MIWADIQRYLKSLRANGFMVDINQNDARQSATARYTLTIASVDEGVRSTTGRSLSEAVENMLKDWESDNREDHGITR